MFENLPGAVQKKTKSEQKSENLKNNLRTIANVKPDKISALKPLPKSQPYKKMTKSDGKFDLKSFFTKDPIKKPYFSQNMSQDHHQDQGTNQNAEKVKPMKQSRVAHDYASKSPAAVMEGPIKRISSLSFDLVSVESVVP